MKKFFKIIIVGLPGGLLILFLLFYYGYELHEAIQTQGARKTYQNIVLFILYIFALVGMFATWYLAKNWMAERRKSKAIQK